MGCAWRETNVEDTDLEAVIQDLQEGQYSNPVRVIGFNPSEGWVRDVSEEVARRLRQHCADEGSELPGRCISSLRKRLGLRSEFLAPRRPLQIAIWSMNGPRP